MTRNLAIACFALLAACAEAERAQPDMYCLAPYQDGISAFLIANADEVADGIVQADLVVVRDYHSDRFRLARKSNDCEPGDKPQSPAQLQDTITANILAASYPASTKWCAVTVAGVDGQASSELFQLVGRSGLGGLNLVTSENFDPSTGEPAGPSTIVRAADECEAVEAIVHALVARSSGER